MKDAKDLIKNSNHFCILPWCHFHAWPDKRVMLCCVADSNLPMSKIEKEQSLLDMVNSDEYKKVRVAMMNDEPSEACKRCYTLEALGEDTMRRSHTVRYGKEFIDIVNATNPDGSLNEFKMTYMDIRFSNKCNFKCRSCGPGCSSAFGQEVVDKKGLKHFQEYHYPHPVVNNCNDGFFEELTPHLADVQEVYFAGGEAILHDEHFKCLDYWIENDLTEQVELSYTTNLSTLTYKGRDLIELWSKFPKLYIWASLDAMGDVAEYMRSGTNWNNIVENMSRIKKEVPHAHFQITPTISIWNIFHFSKFFDWLIDNEYISISKYPNVPRFNLATYPPAANIQILPDYVRKELIDLYTEYSIKYDKDDFSGFKMIVYSLEQGAENKKLIEEFRQINIQLDHYRNESTVTAIPELFEIYIWLKSN